MSKDNMSPPVIQLKLFAGLTPFSPENANRYPIEPGMSVKNLLATLNVPIAKAHLVFINGVKGSLDTPLSGGERVGIFPPIAGG